jgi:hypothetical protein
MKTNFLKIAGLSIALGLAVVACNQDSVTSSSQTTGVVSDIQTANEQSESAYQLADDVTFVPFGGRNFRETGETLDKGDGNFPMLGAGWDKIFKGKDSDCGTVTKTVANNVITIVADYTAVAGGTCNGKAVGGKMTITIPVKPTDLLFSGSMVRTVTYDNLKRDTLVLNGTHTITTTLVSGKAAASEKLATMTILNTSSGKTISYTSTRSRKIDNKSTSDRSDDEASVTGSTNGKSSDGTTFSSNITKALLTKNSCSDSKGFPVSGTEEITPSSGVKKVVDYGDGTCDLKYTETSNGVTVELTRTKGKGKN